MYQVYKLVRMINATYPNNGFIYDVDVTPETELSEDLADVINEALHESYKEVELDEIYTFPTIAGQAEYSLPDDCDMSQIQEVTRSFNIASPFRSGIKSIEEIVEGENPNPENDEVILPFSAEEQVDYYAGGLYPAEHYKKLPEGVGTHYYNQIPRFNPHIGTAKRLVFARDAECLTGDRYYNAWEGKRIGISPTPMRDGEIISIYYKKKPHDVRTMDDDIEIKDKFISILKYNVCAKLAMMGNNPDIDMYNIFTRQYNDLLLEARREKDADLPYYPHTKDNARPSSFLRRRMGRYKRW